MKVEYFATLRELVGEKKEEIKIARVNLRELLSLLCEKHNKLRDELFEGDKLKPYHKILINGKDIRALEGLDTEIKDEDTVSFFPPVGGG